MKIHTIKYLVFVIVICSYSISYSQVGIGTTSPDPSSLLEIVSTDAGLLIPRMTIIQRDNISSPVDGLLIYVVDDKLFYYFNDSSWIPITSNAIINEGSNSIQIGSTLFQSNTHTGTTGNRTVTFPISYTSTPNVVASAVAANDSHTRIVTIRSISTTGFVYEVNSDANGSSGYPIQWMALGKR
mgnify:CR=1 FL=1